MDNKIKIAVDAMGGDNAPNKIIDGIEHHNKISKNIFYRIFGNKEIIESIISNKAIKILIKYVPNIYIIITL